MEFLELQTMITLIENEYPPHERNKPSLLSQLIKDVFGKVVSEEEILRFYGLTEDYERANWHIENGYDI